MFDESAQIVEQMSVEILKKISGRLGDYDV